MRLDPRPDPRATACPAYNTDAGAFFASLAGRAPPQMLRRRSAAMTAGLSELVLPAVREDRGRFAALRGERVLIYWPHGLGDWAHAGYIVPMLEQSNAYAITRFGDDYVSMMEGASGVAPIFSGVRRPTDGAEAGAPHLGLTLRRCDGRAVRAELPATLAAAVATFRPTALLWTDYPETEGRTAYPFHTKARNAARLLTRAERLAEFDLIAASAQRDRFCAAGADAPARRGTARALRPRAGTRRRDFAARRDGRAKELGRRFRGARVRRGDARASRGAWRFVSMDDEDLGEGSRDSASSSAISTNRSRVFTKRSPRAPISSSEFPRVRCTSRSRAAAFPPSGSGSRTIPIGTTSPIRTRSTSSGDTCATAGSTAGRRRRRSRRRCSTASSISIRSRFRADAVVEAARDRYFVDLRERRGAERWRGR